MKREHDHRAHGLAPDPEAPGTTPSRLRRLSAIANYEVADGDPDVRGWRVRAADGQWVGTVHDLVVDMETWEVRYLDVALDRRVASGARTSNDPLAHVLIPLALARLIDDADAVTLTTLTWPALAMLPPFDSDAFSRDDECALLGALAGRPGPFAATDPVFYDRAWFGTTGFRGSRGRSGEGAYRISNDSAGGRGA